jgi:hypothetical protein
MRFFFFSLQLSGVICLEYARIRTPCVALLLLLLLGQQADSYLLLCLSAMLPAC